jgi:hypothetical protein
MQRKPSIVFVHGLWADGSCFGKLIPTLQNEGFEVIASQHGLDSHAGDVDCVKRTLGRAKANTSSLLKRFLLRADEIVNRVFQGEATPTP